MKAFFKRLFIMIIIAVIFFFIIPYGNEKLLQTDQSEVLIYQQPLETPITNSNQIALFGERMTFPIALQDLSKEFHIAEFYYTDMTDGIDAGDYFHCPLLNEQEEEIAYIRVSNLLKNTVNSPDKMTITYMEVSSFTHEDKEYYTPLELIDGITLGSSYKDIKKVFPDYEEEGDKSYRIMKVQNGSIQITFELEQDLLYKMSLQTY